MEWIGDICGPPVGAGSVPPLKPAPAGGSGDCGTPNASSECAGSGGRGQEKVDGGTPVRHTPADGPSERTKHDPVDFFAERLKKNQWICV
jgi:hypothetical protein